MIFMAIAYLCTYFLKIEPLVLAQLDPPTIYTHTYEFVVRCKMTIFSYR